MLINGYISDTKMFVNRNNIDNTAKYANKMQRITTRYSGNHFSSIELAVLMLGVTLEPDADMIFSRENFPDLYEKIEYVLQAYLDGKMKLVLD